jgi:hypothetical protein
MEIAGQTKPMGRAVVLDESKVMPQRSSKDALEKERKKDTVIYDIRHSARKRLAEQPIQQKTEEVADKPNQHQHQHLPRHWFISLK